jgi:hypothetical protein
MVATFVNGSLRPAVGAPPVGSDGSILNGATSQSTDVPASDPSERTRLAVQRCTYMIDWYEVRLRRARIWYRLFQTATIILSGLTPVIILLFQQPPVVQAAPAALASISAALVASFRWREDWIRFAVAAETLRSERAKFLARATEEYAVTVPLERALDTFVFRTESLAISEVSEWRNQLIQKTGDTTRQP